ncbi:M28 family peptidase [Rosenbergiella nectarea]|uniref:M28 family peptidase n=1 Tax=Rosenbergiella nectarea TaxID=988801 RepID=UPI001BDB1C39|nr:M28 family peptidase [Rosenbergiella nectarea]MBT0729814.1 M28 family peptidase [Rosenbergiella nectarea subsp. apis]
MLSLLKNKLALAALCLGFLLTPFAGHAESDSDLGKVAEQHTRYIATYFPGRMSGTPAEFLTAEYLLQQFSQLGYRAHIRHEPGAARPLSATSVVAERPGQLPQEIVVITHIDTPQSYTAQQRLNNVGGLNFQGVDNNAASLGVMLELAKRLADHHNEYSLRFVALGGTQPPLQGMSDYLKSLSIDQRKNMLLVVDMTNIVAGKHLAFLSGNTTAAAVRKQTTDQAKAIAQQHAIQLLTAQLASSRSRTLTAYEQVGLPYLRVTSSDAGKLTTLATGETQSVLRDNAAKDNLAYINRHYPHRLTQRSYQLVTILTPLLRGLLTPTHASAIKH